MMEPIFEPETEGNATFLRCPSPKYTLEEKLGHNPEPMDCDARLDVYLEEVQGYLDYLNDVETEIKDQQDLHAIDDMREVCEKAVLEHKQMCDVMVMDIVKMSVEADKQIEQAKALGIVANREMKLSESGTAFVKEMHNQLVLKKEPEDFQEKVEEQKGIESGAQAQPVLAITEGTDEITSTLKDVFSTLQQFTKDIQKHIPELEAKFGLENDTLDEATAAPVTAAIRTEERQEELKYRKMAKEASKFMEAHG